VGVWRTLAVALVGVAVLLAVPRLYERYRDQRLRRHGASVDAVVWDGAGARVRGRPVHEEMPARLEFTWQGADAHVVGRLRPRHGRFLTGDVVPLYVDPSDLDNWTVRTAAPPPLWETLLGSLLTLAVVPPVLVKLWLERSRVLRAWRDGEPRRAVVVSADRAPLAPRSWAVRCALAEGSDKRVLRVHVRRGTTKPNPRDELWLLVPPGRPQGAVAAERFV
jgi:hypothetical protein